MLRKRPVIFLIHGPLLVCSTRLLLSLQHPKASTDQVRSALVKAHETWLIPDRRLNKFVKRQKAGKPMTADDDTVAKGPGHRIRGLFTIKASEPKGAKKSVKEPVVVKPKSPEAAPPKEVKKEEVPETEPKVDELPAVAEDKAAAYVDDNDGSTGGPCAACEGCTIL